MNKIQKRDNNTINTTDKLTTLTSKLHGLHCPTCNSKKHIKNGKVQGNQRYKCSKCGKNFRSTTEQTIHHLHLKHKIKAYITCMHQGLSLRKTAKQLDISLQTAFRWRHLLLSTMRKQPQKHQHPNRTLSAYTLPFSTKRKRTHTEKKATVTSILQYDTTRTISIEVLGKYGQKAHQIAQTNKLSAEIIPSKHIPKPLKSSQTKCTSEEQITQNKQFQKHITEWLNTFRGVASKYLQNYWVWFTHFWNNEVRIKEEQQYLLKCL